MLRSRNRKFTEYDTRIKKPIKQGGENPPNKNIKGDDDNEKKLYQSKYRKTKRNQTIK